jgi:hypothetical protein
MWWRYHVKEVVIVVSQRIKGSMKATCGNNGGVVSKEGLVLNHVVEENQGVELGMSRVQSWYNEPIFA